MDLHAGSMTFVISLLENWDHTSSNNSDTLGAVSKIIQRFSAVTFINDLDDASNFMLLRSLELWLEQSIVFSSATCDDPLIALYVVVFSYMINLSKNIPELRYFLWFSFLHFAATYVPIKASHGSLKGRFSETSFASQFSPDSSSRSMPVVAG